MNILLEVKNLKKVCANNEANQIILNDVNMEILKGEFVSVMGPSGSGKSTLLYNISGMDKPTSGQVKIFGKEITTMQDTELSEIRLKQMGFVFQQPYLIKSLSVRDNVVLSASILSRYGDNLRKKADKIMELTGIKELAKRDVNTLSGGEAQRVGICRALINEPQIIFADEPTGSLNSKSSDEIMEIFREINHKGTAIIVVTHDAKVAIKTNKVLFMKDGVIENELIFNSNHSHKERLDQVHSEMNRLGI